MTVVRHAWRANGPACCSPPADRNCPAGARSAPWPSPRGGHTSSGASAAGPWCPEARAGADRGSSHGVSVREPATGGGRHGVARRGTAWQSSGAEP